MVSHHWIKAARDDMQFRMRNGKQRWTKKKKQRTTKRTTSRIAYVICCCNTFDWERSKIIPNAIHSSQKCVDDEWMSKRARERKRLRNSVNIWHKTFLHSFFLATICDQMPSKDKGSEASNLNHNAHVIMQIVIIKRTPDKMIPPNSLAFYLFEKN